MVRFLRMHLIQEAPNISLERTLTAQASCLIRHRAAAPLRR